MHVCDIYNYSIVIVSVSELYNVCCLCILTYHIAGIIFGGFGGLLKHMHT